MLNSFYEGVIVIVCINIIAVLGMSVLTGFTRLFSFGNAGFMSIGAYGAAICSVQLKLPFPVSILIGALAAGIVAFLLGSLTIRLRGDYFLISCLGFGECVRVLFNYTRNITGGANGYSNIPYCTTALVAFASAVLAFVFSALYAGWAGGLYAHYLRYITPALFNLSKSSELIITTVLGGLGSLTGSVLGTIIVQLLPEIFRSLAEYRMLVYGIAVVLVILLRPNGLYGYREFSLKRVVTAVSSRLGKGVKSHE